MGPPRVSLHAPLDPSFSCSLSSPLSLSFVKRETKLLPGDVLTQHLICKVVPDPPPSPVISKVYPILSFFFLFLFSFRLESHQLAQKVSTRL